MYEIDWDSNGGILRVTASGFWTLELVEAYLLELTEKIGLERARGEFVRVLVDARGAQAQGLDVIDKFASENWMCHPADRMAVLVDSTLLKMQVRRTLPDARAQAFSDPLAAKKWIFDIQ